MKNGWPSDNPIIRQIKQNKKGSYIWQYPLYLKKKQVYRIKNHFIRIRIFVYKLHIVRYVMHTMIQTNYPPVPIAVT